MGVLHVAGVLQVMLHPNPLTINNCCAVAPFPDNTSTYRFLGFSDPCLPFIIHQQRQHVAGLLPFVLPVKVLWEKDVADVAGSIKITH